MVKQKIPSSQKDREWRLQNLREKTGLNFNGQRNQDTIRQFNIAAGIFDQSSYTHIINPYNLKGKKYRKYPENLKNFDILSPRFLRLKSEYEKRPFEPIVYTHNSNFQNERLAFEKSLIDQSLNAKFINALVQSGQLSKEQAQEEMSPDVIKNKVSSLKDLDTIEGQHILNYVIDKQNIERKYSQEFYNLCVTNRCVTYKDVRNDEVIKLTTHNSDFQWTGNENLMFFEDAEVVKATWNMTFEDMFLFEEQFIKDGYSNALDQLEQEWNNSNGVNGMAEWYSVYHRNFYGEEYNTNSTLTKKSIIVQHIQWTSYRKVFIIGYDERTNDPIIVDEDYVGDYISERYQEEIREGYVINNKYYLGGECVEYPIYDINDPFKAKKNYTGIVFMNNIVQQVSLPDKLIQYQEAYNVLKWKLQYTVNKNKDKIATIPIGLVKGAFAQDAYNSESIVDSAEKAEEELMGIAGKAADHEDDNNPIAKAMYYADATQMLFIDETYENAAIAIQALKSIDLGLGNYIEYLMKMLQQIVQETDDVLGFNRFVTGDYDSKDPVRNVQQGLKQSSVIVELYFRAFELYKQNDLQGILNLSKYAYKSGRALTYIRSNTSIEMLKVSDNFNDQTKGVFIKDGVKTQEIMDMLKSKSNELLQNGMSHSTWAKMIVGDSNYASIIQDIENAEVDTQQQAQAQQKAEMDNQQALQDKVDASKKLDRDLKKYEIDTNAEVAIDRNIATLQSFQLGKPDGADAMVKLTELGQKQQADLLKHQQARESNETSLQIARENNATKRADSKDKVKIATVNKN